MSKRKATPDEKRRFIRHYLAKWRLRGPLRAEEVATMAREARSVGIYSVNTSLADVRRGLGRFLGRGL